MTLISSRRILSSIFWTRTAVLILAIVVVAASLTVYSVHTAPIFTLFSNTKTEGSSRSNNSIDTNSAIMIEMVQDRRLISTLVAAQASVFCPLFLLLTSNPKTTTTSAVLDLVCCHVLMPFGLAMSWIFCILFDRKTMTAVTRIGRHDRWYAYLWPHNDVCLINAHGQWACIAINVIHALKYLIVLVLLVEIVLVVVGALFERYVTKRGAIQLGDDEENEEKRDERYDEESRGEKTVVSYMDSEQCAVLQV